jgi:ABC-2 type transport system permease protein
MAVVDRAWHGYQGRLTPERWRFLVLPRYAYREVLEQRLLTAFLVLCFVPFLVEIAMVYIANSTAAQAMLQLRPGDVGRLVSNEFFLGILSVQGALAFFLTAWLAPVLVSPDLVNGALPLYLARPFTRAEYVLGKAAVLTGLLSLITWVPCLVVFSVQAGMAPSGWLAENLRLAWALFVGAWVWIAVLTLMGLALSAWIRWRLVASAALFGIFFMGGAFGEIWREVLHSAWGRLVNLSYMIGIVWRDLFGIVSRRSLAREMLDDHRRGATDLPVLAAWLGLLAVCAVSLWLLNRRLRAREVIA